MRRIMMATLMTLAVAACGPQPEARPAGAVQPLGSATSAQPSVPPGPTSVPPSRPTTGGVGPSLVAVRGLPPGPASPDTPPPFRWYASLRDGQCAGLADTATDTSLPEVQRAMFAALTPICQVLAGEQAKVDWDRARAAFDASSGETNCLVAAARQYLGAVISAHDSAPQVVLTTGPAAEGTACPVGIDSVEMASPGELVAAGPYLFEPSAARVGSRDLQVGFPEVDVSSGVPQVRIPLAGGDGFCLPAGQPATLEVIGNGYSVSAGFAPADVGQGACTGDADGTAVPDGATG